MPSTGCSPGPTSARCWSSSANRPSGKSPLVLAEHAVQRLLRLGQGFQDLGPGLGELLLLLVGARPVVDANLPRDFEMSPVDQEALADCFPPSLEGPRR